MLKKLFAILITASLFVGCGGAKTEDLEDLGKELIASDNTGISRAKIVEISENSVLLCEIEDENSIYSLTTMGVDNLPDEAKAGSIIDIHFDGYVMESYPSQISNIDKIEVVEQDFDIVGLFLELIKELYDKNGYLVETNDIAVSLITDEILTKGEQFALLYMIGWKLDDNKLYNVYAREVYDNNILYDNEEEIMFYIDSKKSETGFIFDIGMLLPVAVEEYDGDFVLMNWYGGCQININGEEYEYINGIEFNDVF